MALPTFDATKHDVGINGIGYMLTSGQRQDLRPATSRASAGEGRYDFYETESYVALSRFGGGAGQQRLEDSGSYGTGVGDGRYGRWFPARKWQTADYGNASEGFFAIGSRLFGITTTGIEEIHHATNTWSRTLGNITSPVRVSGNGYAFWTQTVSGKQRLFKFNPGVGAPEDCTPPGMSNVSVVAPYGTAMWAFGTYLQESDPEIVQFIPGTANTNIVTWTNPPTLGNTCFVVIAVEGDAADIHAPTITGYTKVADVQPSANGGQRKPYTGVFARLANPDDVNAVMTGVTASGGGSGISYKMYLLEVSGLEGTYGSVLPAPDATLKSVAPWTVNNAVGAPNVFLPYAKEFVLSVWNRTDINTVITGYTQEAGFTELVDERPTTKTRLSIAHKTTTAVEDTEFTRTTSTSGSASIEDRPANITVVYRASRFDVDTDLFMVSKTDDDGITWTDAISPQSTAIEQPKSALAAQGFLWFTTPQGLYYLEEAVNPATGKDRKSTRLNSSH